LTDQSIFVDVQQTLHSTYSMFGESLGSTAARAPARIISVSEDADRYSRHPSVSEEAEINSRPSSYSPPSLEVLGPQPLYKGVIRVLQMLEECYINVMRVL
jgi:hypothetical protein